VRLQIVAVTNACVGHNRAAAARLYGAGGCPLRAKTVASRAIKRVRGTELVTELVSDVVHCCVCDVALMMVKSALRARVQRTQTNVIRAPVLPKEQHKKTSNKCHKSSAPHRLPLKASPLGVRMPVVPHALLRPHTVPADKRRNQKCEMRACVCAHRRVYACADIK
jgi:hypothetical protein